MEETSSLNAYITPTPEIALSSARESEARISRGEARPLDGIPLGIKDMFCTSGVKTTAASKILHNFVPTYESTVTQKLFDDGAVMLGKQNQDQFAMGTTGDTSFFGPALNPWDTRCVPGGSSSGGAVSVACGSALGAIGTDTGGSIRQPAAFCGIVGIRPTYGRCSRFGIVSYASSFDQASALARNVSDAAIILQSMCGHDARDSTSANISVPDFSSLIGSSVKGLRVGIPQEWILKDGIEPEVMAAWENGKKWLLEAGCEIVPISLPHSALSLACYYILVPAEASSNLSRYDGVRYGHRSENASNMHDLYFNTRAEGFGWEVKRRIMIGTYILSQGFYDAYYKKAQKLRALIRHEFATAFKSVDVILSPTAPNTAFPLDESPTDPVSLYMGDILTCPVNVGGVTAISVPAGVNNAGKPIGLQVIAKAFAEEKLFQFANIIEQCANMPKLPLDKAFA